MAIVVTVRGSNTRESINQLGANRQNIISRRILCTGLTHTHTHTEREKGRGNFYDCSDDIEATTWTTLDWYRRIGIKIREEGERNDRLLFFNSEEEVSTHLN
jgi:hypothetical protein